MAKLGPRELALKQAREARWRSPIAKASSRSGSAAAGAEPSISRSTLAATIERIAPRATPLGQQSGKANSGHSRSSGRPRVEDRHKTVEAQKPWVTAGMSRATWYARQAELRRAR